MEKYLKTGERDLRALFGEAGTVELVEMVNNPQTGKSRGFAFVTMSSQAEAEKAKIVVVEIWLQPYLDDYHANSQRALESMQQNVDICGIIYIHQWKDAYPPSNS